MAKTKTSFEFLDEADPDFRKKIASCYVSIAKIMDNYRIHFTETAEENRKSASAFLEEDFILDMMVKDFDCRESVLHVMKNYAEAVF